MPVWQLIQPELALAARSGVSIRVAGCSFDRSNVGATGALAGAFGIGVETAAPPVVCCAKTHFTGEFTNAVATNAAHATVSTVQ